MPKHFTWKGWILMVLLHWFALVSAEICTRLSSFTHTHCIFPHISSLPRYSDTTGLWSVSLVVLGFVSGPLLQRRGPTPHTLHPLAAGQCWRPLPWAGGTGWMRTTQLYETPVTHKHRCCQYSTLGTLMLLLLDWEMLLHLEHFLDNARICVCHGQIVEI